MLSAVPSLCNSIYCLFVSVQILVRAKLCLTIVVFLGTDNTSIDSDFLSTCTYKRARETSKECQTW